MDTTKPTEVTHLSLCTGYGGIDLGLRRCIPSLRTIAYAEIEASAIELLLARMESGALDAAPVWTNLRTFPWGSFSGRVDILSGGYPCQPFSAAGKRLGADDPRHLWPAIADGIRVLRPQTVFFENVEGHITLGLSSVLSDLEELGYEATWGVFSASEVGAPHQRKRVFIMAYRKGEGLEGYDGLLAGCGESGRNAPQPQGQAGGGDSGRDAWPSRPGEQQFWWEPPRVVADTGRNQRQRRSAMGEVRAGDAGETCEGQGSGCTGTDQAGQWQECEPVCSDTEPKMECGIDKRKTESEVGGGADGAADWMDYAELCYASDNRTDELRMLGNGVVPATAARAFETLMKELL